MKVSYIERNGRRYAYSCTSKRVSGKKNPVSKMTYLGVVDPGTGEVIPKKIRKDIGKTTEIPQEIEMKNLGDTLLAISIAKGLKIHEDLETVFGERHRMVLAIALAEAIRPSPTNLVDTVLKSSAIPELLGLEPADISRKNVMNTVNSVDKGSMERFFKLRWRRSGGKAMVFSHAVSLSNGFQDTLGNLNMLTNTDDATISIVTGADGSLIGFSLIYRPSSDISGAIETMETMRSVGIDGVYVSNTAISTSLKLDELILHNLDFIIPYSVASPQFHRISGSYGDLSDPRYNRDFKGDTYQLKEETIGFAMEGGRYVPIPPADSNYEEQGATLKSFMVFDPRINNETVRSLNKLVRNIKDSLNGMTSDDPETALSMIAGQLAPLFRCVTEPDGTLKVSVKRRAMAEFHGNAGKALILSRSSSWDEIIRARETLKGINNVTEQFYKGSRWMMKYIWKGADVQGQMFMEFIALLIYDSVRRRLESCNEEYDVEDAFLVASTFRGSIVDGKFVHSPMNRRVRKVFEIFGLEQDESMLCRTVSDATSREQPSDPCGYTGIKN